MNTLLMCDIGQQKHVETVRRGERIYAQKRALVGTNRRRTRERVATLLVVVASRLQPGLRCETPPRPTPATA